MRQWLYAFFVFVTVVSVCVISNPAIGSGSTMTAVATIHPVADIIGRLGGDAVNAVTLLPPGASPHTFEPRPTAMRHVASASLFVAVGGGLDDWAGDLVRSAESDTAVLSLVQSVREAGMGLPFDSESPIAETGDGHGALDPHVWLDPLIMRDVIAPDIAAALIQLSPGDAQDIESRLHAVQNELSALDHNLREQLKAIDNRKFIAYHSAWRYFARRFDLEQAAAVTPLPGQEPSPQWLVKLVQLAEKNDVRVVFAEPQLNPRAAETIAREIQGQVLILDPIGGAGVTGRESYDDLLRYNTEIFVQGLGG